MIEVVLSTAIVAAIYGLVVLSLNLQYGLTGLLNFGQNVFFAVGAYSVAVGFLHNWPIWSGWVSAAVLGALMGLLMALPVRRLRQEYWALMTLGVSELFLTIMDNQESLAGGTFGTYGIPPTASDPVLLLILVLLIAVVLVAFERIKHSQFGRVIQAIREDETLVGTLGRDVFRYQVRVMMIGGLVAAVAGAFYAHYISAVSTASFSLAETFVIWTMLIIGGTGNNYGALLGAVILQGLLVGTRFFNSSFLTGTTFAIFRMVAIGAVLVLFIILRPQGALPERRRRFRVGG